MNRTFYGLLDTAWEMSLICVGLDPLLEKLPPYLLSAHRGSVGDAIIEFNKGIIDGTRDLACAYKLNSSHYEAFGDEGMRALRRSIDHVRVYAPKAVVILDFKRGDSYETNKGYAKAAFDIMKVDAITLSPYMGGKDTFLPFLEREDKGVIFMCKTSNKDSSTFQDLQSGGRPLYMHVASRVMEWNAHYRNCGLVVGATHPTALERVRHLIGDNMPILCPGVGAQGGDAEMSVKVGRNSKGAGILIALSSGITYPAVDCTFQEKARRRFLRAVTSTSVPLPTRSRKAKTK